VKRMQSNSQVKRILTRVLNHVLVRRNTTGFQRLGRDLFLLERHQVHARRERVHGVLLHASIVDSDFRVRNASAIPRFRVRFVLDHAVTARGTCCVLSRFVGFHRELKKREREVSFKFHFEMKKVFHEEDRLSVS
jgi:hypothetical protein